MTESDFVSLWAKQGGKCAICGNSPTTGRLCIDHQHGIKGYKKLPPEIRRKYTRGLLCWTCNRLIVGRGVTLERLQKAVQYIQGFNERTLLPEYRIQKRGYLCKPHDRSKGIAKNVGKNASNNPA